MPLVYDDIPGSWGVYSKSWPSIKFQTLEQANRAFIACTKAKVVPYGSYVMCNLELRCETGDLKNKLLMWLNECPHKTYAELREHFINTGQWSN